MPDPGQPSRPSGPARGGADGTSASALLLLRLRTLPRLVVPIAVLALVLVGLMAPPVLAVPALGLVLALLGFLASFTWPHLGQRGRMLRMVAMGVVAALLVSRAAALL